MSRQPAALALVPVLIVSGCGGDRSPTAPSPTAPSTPWPPTVLTVLSGEDEKPAAGAVVALGGSRLGTDATGRVTLPDSARRGDPIDILAAGFFARLTTVPSESSVVGLWPLTSPAGLNESFTARLVYTSTQAGSPLGEEPLRRPEGPVYLVPSADLVDDARAVAEMAYAAEKVNDAVEGRLPFSVNTAPPSDGVRFDVRVDRSDPTCRRALAFCRRRLRGDSITGGEIVFCDLGTAYTDIMTHEVGHAFGLQHSTSLYDMMGETQILHYRIFDFTRSEKLVMRLMLRRSPGNRYPDTDRAPSPASSRSELLVCR
jgi:hypothetical protein